MNNEKQATIVVNGTLKQVDKEELTFEQVVELAFTNPWQNPNIIYTIAYRRGHGNKQGTMVQGGDPVKVKDEMIFDVTPTDKS